MKKTIQVLLCVVMILAVSIGVVGCTKTQGGTGQGTCEVTDIAGRSTSTDNNTIIIDTIYPDINFTLGTESSGVNLSQNWIFVNVSVNETNLVNMTFYLYNETSGEVGKSIFYDLEESRNWTGLSDGIYYYNVSVVDKINQINTTLTNKITLDNTGPSINIIDPENSQILFTVNQFSVSTDIFF